MGVAVDEGDDVVVCQGFPEALEVLSRPVVFGAIGVEVERDDDRSPRIADLFGEVLAEELKAGAGGVVVPLPALFALAGEDADGDAVEGAPVPGVVEAIG